MTIPDHNDPFNEFYDQFSVEKRLFQIPDHFDVYRPDYSGGLECVSVICPSKDRGAKIWTYNGKWITIGIYRDLGRETAQRPARTGLVWSRTGKVLRIIDETGHKLQTGDVVNLYNVNVTQLLNRTITRIDEQVFSVEVPLIGDLDGMSGAYQPANEWNFREDSYVFRLLPSFRLVPYSLIQELFEVTAPDAPTPVKQMYDVTAGSMVKVPTTQTRNTNYQLPVSALSAPERLSLALRFNQAFTADGDPLALSYKLDGQPVDVNNVDSENKINPVKYDYRDPLVELSGCQSVCYDVPPFDGRVYVYDFYGLDINDPSRGPWHSSVLISRDTTVTGSVNNFKRFDNGSGVPLYSGLLFDNFANKAVGVQENYALTLIKNVLPLQLDAFNRPVKSSTPKHFEPIVEPAGSLAAPVFFNSTFNTPTIDYTHTVSVMPVSKGNLIVLFIAFDADNPPTSELPTGWLLRADESLGIARVRMYVKGAVISDSNQELTFTFNSIASPAIIIERWGGSFTDPYTAVRSISVDKDTGGNNPIIVPARDVSTSSSLISVGLEGSAIDQLGLAASVLGAGWTFNLAVVNPMRNSALATAHASGSSGRTSELRMFYGRATTDHLTLVTELRAS